MTALAELDAATCAAAIRSGDLKSEELVRACLQQIDLVEPQLRAFRDLVLPDEALNYARKLDDRKVRRGALYGVPVAIKEVFDVARLHCGWGTSIHQARVPDRDAAAVAKLRNAGAVILGTTISTEYAIAAAGPTTNPYDKSRTPGGSSSGSAAAVAACMVPLALGTQTVGSIVRPATYCGVYGFKPAYGAVDKGGVMPLSSRLDHVGILARTPADIALTYGTLLDRGSIGCLVADHLTSDSMKTLSNVYLVESNLCRRIDSQSRTALKRARNALESAGATVTPTDLPDDLAEAGDCLNTILCRDIAVNHGDDRDRAGEQMSERMRDLVDRGRVVSNERYVTATSRARQYRQSLLDILANGSVILAPATDGVAPCLKEGTGSPDLQALYSLTGLPTLAVPCGTVDGLPVGVQIVAAPETEVLLFAAARAISAAAEIQSV
jgi:Asp-tRNA(Asn)/Glu-tRNA(Gln) amidotransferase A subunit family amidase